MLQSRMANPQAQFAETESDIQYELASGPQDQICELELYPECQQLRPRHRGKAYPPQLLLVDDDLHQCDHLAELLTELGYQVDVAHEGEEALHYVKRTEYRLAVMDFSLPDMDGIELYDHIRQARNRREFQAVFLTSSEDTDAAQAARLRGVEGVVSKPVDPVELIQHVQNVTQSSVSAHS